MEQHKNGAAPTPDLPREDLPSYLKVNERPNFLEKKEKEEMCRERVKNSSLLL